MTMKNLLLMILTVIGTINISAQVTNVPNNSDLNVIESKWRFMQKLDANLDSDPFRANNEQREFEGATIQNMRGNQIRAAEGLPAEPPPSRISSTPETPKPTVNGSYIYQITVKNTGQKNIRSVIWDYIFIDTADKSEAGRRHFVSVKKIHSGDTEKLTEKSNFYPTTTINASKSGKKFKDNYLERIVINKIEYDDGTVWKAP